MYKHQDYNSAFFTKANAHSYIHEGWHFTHTLETIAITTSFP